MMRIAFPALVATAAAAAATADPADGRHMMEWGYGWGAGMIFAPILWLIVLGLIVAAIIWFVRQSDTGRQGASRDAQAELDMRLARGEIDAEDYVARKKLLGG